MKSFISQDGYIAVVINKVKEPGFRDLKPDNFLERSRTLARVTLTQDLLLNLVKLLNKVNQSNNVIELSIKHKKGIKDNYLYIENDDGELFVLAPRTDKLSRREKK